MKTTIQNKPTNFNALGFIEITNLIAIKGGNVNDPEEKGEIEEKKKENEVD